MSKNIISQSNKNSQNSVVNTPSTPFLKYEEKIGVINTYKTKFYRLIQKYEYQQLSMQWNLLAFFILVIILNFF